MFHAALLAALLVSAPSPAAPVGLPEMEGFTRLPLLRDYQVVGFSSTDASTLRLCRSLTASGWQSFVMVRFPFALPAIFSGMKIAMTMAIIGVIIGEFISAKAGLGFYILYASSRMETGVIFAALFVLCVIGVTLFGAVALAEGLVRRSYGRR